MAGETPHNQRSSAVEVDSKNTRPGAFTKCSQGASCSEPSSGVTIELVQQLHRGSRMDAEGSRIVRRFLEDHPHMLPHFRAQAQQVRDPNHRKMFNTLLARAQAA